VVFLVVLTTGLAAACADSAKRASGLKPLLVAALGDGVTAGSPGYDPNHALRNLLGFGDNPGGQWEYWAQQRNPRLSFRNCGLYDQPTDQIALRPTSCARGADVLVIEGGIDDIRQGRSPATAARNIDRMVKHAKRLGLRVEVTELLPWNNGYPDAAKTIQTLNTRIHTLAQLERVPVLPFYTTLEDPIRPGRMKDTWTAEGDYPSAIGYRRLGQLAFHLPPS
jgi:lysophospholipase L1-like esterase